MSLVEKMLLLGVQKRMTIIRTPIGNSRLVRLPFQQAEFNFRTAPHKFEAWFHFPGHAVDNKYKRLCRNLINLFLQTVRRIYLSYS